MSIWTREEEKAHRSLSAVRLLSDTRTICVTRESFLRSSSDTLNQKGLSSMMSFLPESRVETVEQSEEQIPAIACAYQTDALASDGQNLGSLAPSSDWKPLQVLRRSIRVTLMHHWNKVGEIMADALGVVALYRFKTASQ